MYNINTSINSSDIGYTAMIHLFINNIHTLEGILI